MIHALKIMSLSPRILIPIVLSLSLIIGCGKPKELDPRVIGTWGLQQSGGVEILVEFLGDGKFKVNQAKDMHSNSSGSASERASGIWNMDTAKSQVTLTTQKGDPKMGWPPQTVVYTVIALNPLTLHLMDPEGKHHIWKKMSKEEKKPEAGEKGKVVTLKISPLVANLAPSKISTHQQYRWICTGVEIILVNYDPSFGLHPQIQEKAIFFFSSKTYSDLNTPTKLVIAANELKDVLNPYLDNRISGIRFEKTTITGRADVVDQFLAGAENSGGEKNQEETGKTH
jgi:hypothetical protein